MIMGICDGIDKYCWLLGYLWRKKKGIDLGRKENDDAGRETREEKRECGVVVLSLGRKRKIWKKVDEDLTKKKREDKLGADGSPLNTMDMQSNS